MREFLFILIVILVILGLTAIRYRKHIASLVGFARVLKEVREGTNGRIMSSDPKGTELVNCDKCGVWVPKTKAIGAAGKTICSKACLSSVREVS